MQQAIRHQPDNLNELGMIATVSVVQGADAPLSQEAVYLLWAYFRSYDRRPLLVPDVWAACGETIVAAAHTVGSTAAFLEAHEIGVSDEISRESVRRALSLVSSMGIPFMTADETLVPLLPN